MRIEHELYALSDAATKNYPIEVNVEYESGGEKQNITRYIGVLWKMIKMMKKTLLKSQLQGL